MAFMKDRQIIVSGPRPAGFVYGWLLAAGLMALVFVLVLLPPFVNNTVRAGLMGGFSMVCHQLPERSPHLLGVALAVCHRCFGIYVGLLLAAVAFVVLWRWEPVLNRYAKYLLGLSLVPLALDWGFHVLGWWINTPGSRAVTGGLFGLVAGCYVARAMVQLTTSGEAASKGDIARESAT